MVGDRWEVGSEGSGCGWEVGRSKMSTQHWWAE